MAIASCAKQEVSVVTPDTPISFCVKQNSMFAFTKATESALVDDDEIQIIAGTPVSAASKATVSGTNLVLTNPIYWKKGQTASADFVAIYPYTSSTSTTVDYNLNYGGNHDFNYHKLYLVAKASSAPTEEKIALNFRHPFSKVLINVTNQLGNDGVASVELKSIKMEGVLDLVAETVNLEGKENVNVTASKLSDTQWGAIVMPQSAQPQLVVTTELGSVYTFTLPAAFNFEAGKVATAAVTLVGQGGSGDDHGDAASFSFTVTDWSAAAENPGFEGGSIAMGNYWYVLGTVYQEDNTVGAWAKDFPMTYGGKNNQDKEIWTITINYDEAKATAQAGPGFKLRKYSSATPEDEKWNVQLGMSSEDPNTYVDIDYTYDLSSSNNKDIRFEEAGRYTLTLTGSTLSVEKIPAN